MAIFAPRLQQSVSILPLPQGVFEDDALLLRLAVHSQRAESARPCATPQIDLDDLAIERERLAACATWIF